MHKIVFDRDNALFDNEGNSHPAAHFRNAHCIDAGDALRTPRMAKTFQKINSAPCTKLAHRKVANSTNEATFLYPDQNKSMLYQDSCFIDFLALLLGVRCLAVREGWVALARWCFMTLLTIFSGYLTRDFMQAMRQKEKVL
ncbi:MAG: hypothetical protein ACYYK0_00505 [Candidatus Eutrophobiaceae bacterium]